MHVFTRDTAKIGYTSGMRRPAIARIQTAATLVLALAIAACGSASNSASAGSPQPIATRAEAPAAAARETPVPPEVNPPGDIPDSQAYVRFVAASYSLQAPEGWARTVRGANVTFRDKYDGLSVDLTTTPQTLASIEAHASAGSGFTSTAVTLPAGTGTKIRYSSNSEADPVTGKKIRLANESVIFVSPRPGTVHLWAPLGADNVDQWNFIERSFLFRLGTR
jgi:hypothetical protein